jgi:hypothetical protein
VEGCVVVCDRVVRMERCIVAVLLATMRRRVEEVVVLLCM